MRTFTIISIAALACAFALLIAGCAHRQTSPTPEELKALEKEITDLQEQNQQLQENIEKMREQIRQYKVAVQELQDELSSRGEEGRPAQTPLDATVTEVKRDNERATVTLNKGTKAGFKVGAKLFAWNSAEGFKGTLTVTDVTDDSSTARIESEEEGKEIKAGDTATIQNF